ncbi:hypothetical protein [Holophaga foetida]|uniref:hypothetical protein n=1 Tax=Holophaga foetida TaxID=35839 RepID=UPI0002473748|nr:hypothetical protein [Holophaga foetida]
MAQIVDFTPLGSAGGDPRDILLLDILSNNSVDLELTARQALLQSRRGKLAKALAETGDTRAVRKLSRCGAAKVRVEGPFGAYWKPKGCHAAYCPVCNGHKAQRIFNPMRPEVLRIMGTRGCALHLVIAGPETSDALSFTPLKDRLHHLLRQARKALGGYRWRTYFAKRVGVVLCAEIGRGSKDLGHPHIHLFACAASIKTIQSFALWLNERWQDLVPHALPLQTDKVSRVGAGFDWAKSLWYALKGTRLGVDWGPELLFEAVCALSSGLRLVTTQGLLKGNWLGSKREAA